MKIAVIKLIGIAGLPLTFRYRNKVNADFAAAAEHARILSYNYGEE